MAAVDVRETDLLLNRTHRNSRLEKVKATRSPYTLAQMRPWQVGRGGPPYQSSPHVAFVQHIALAAPPT